MYGEFRNFSCVAGLATVESKRELIEIELKMSRANASVMRSQ